MKAKTKTKTSPAIVDLTQGLALNAGGVTSVRGLLIDDEAAKRAIQHAGILNALDCPFDPLQQLAMNLLIALYAHRTGHEFRKRTQQHILVR